MLRHLACFTLLIALLPATALAQSRPNIGPALDRVIRESPDRMVPAWVYFTDRGGDERDPAAFARARAGLTARALDRRLRRGTLTDVTESDLPVHAAYVRALISRGARLRGASRWLNAASVDIPARLATEIARWPFVSRVEQVTAAWPLRPLESSPVEPAPPAVGLDRASPGEVQLAPGDTAYYGATFKQLSMMQVPQLHALGLRSE